MVEENIYYQGGIYLKKTVNEKINSKTEFIDLLMNMKEEEKSNNGYSDIERFYVLNINQKDEIILIAAARYKYQAQIKKIPNYEELNEKYIYLIDFLNKAKYIGKQYGIVNEKHIEMKPGIALYSLGDRLLVERRDIVTGKQTIDIVLKKGIQEFTFRGLVDEKYNDINKVYSIINKQITDDLFEMNKENKQEGETKGNTL